MSSLLYLERKDLARARRDVDYLNDARAALILDANPFAGLSLLFILVVLGSGYLWADRAVMDEVTRGEGKIVPSSHEQVIQSLEGGILANLMVSEGDVVEPDQVLLRIDDTRFGATMREGQLKAAALKASIARLTAEARGSEPVFPADVGDELVEAERKLFNSRRKTMNESISSLARNLSLAEEELSMTEPLVARGAVSEVEVLRLRRQVVELRGKIQERRNGFRADARGELAIKEAELAGVMQINEARTDQVRRTRVRTSWRSCRSRTNC
jgi:multidrug efflux pump subunit AcrA (membrane-fusion protein)